MNSRQWPARVSSLHNGEVSTFEVTPPRLDSKHAIFRPQGGDAEYNATALTDLLDGNQALTATQ